MNVIAIDANFQLRRRVISNETRDPALSSGWGYFVEDVTYQEFLKNQVEDDEVTTFIRTLHTDFDSASD